MARQLLRLPKTYSVGIYKSTGLTFSSGTAEADITAFTDNLGTEGGVTVDLTAGTFTVPAGGAGWWTFDILTVWVANGAGIRDVSLYVNGALQEQSSHAPNGSTAINNRTTFLFELAVGDVVKLGAYQNSGGNLTLAGCKLKAFSTH